MDILISVVDEDESVRDGTESLLRSEGYRVATFESGELFLQSGAAAETECLILDMRMPGMDGLEVQRRIKRSERCFPVIFMSAHDGQRLRQRALEAGAADFFPKPFGASAFLAAVRAALKKQLAV